jgi:hypothetical protein
MYDALWLECRTMVRALKKFWFWLFGQYFTTMMDSQTLMWILNQPPIDLPNGLMSCWLAYIRLFEFDIEHVPGNKNSVADGLSRRGRADVDSPEEDPDDY